jgi:hypothetical protein
MADVSSHSSQDAAPPSGDSRDTFVVRIWTSDGGDVLRGHVQHVRTRRRAYFATRERLMRFIQDHLQGDDDDPCQS